MSLQLEMVSCGDCRACLAGGKAHGPYWYRYFRRGGRMVSEYVGKEVSHEHATKGLPEGSTPEDLYPELVERIRAESRNDAEARWDALPNAQQELIGSIVGMKAAARRAYRRSRKADGDARERAAAIDEQRELTDRIGAEKAKLRETFVAETVGA